MLPETAAGLDPADWTELRRIGHAMLDDMFDHMERLRDQPVWRPPTAAARAAFVAPPPRAPTPLSEVHAQFRRDILPFGGGNAHPGFMGWVQGGGGAVGMLAEMLAAGLNANVGGRDHIAVEVERQVARWFAELFAMPPDASGLFVTGASMANFMAVLIARTFALGAASRSEGVAACGLGLTAYAAQGAHGCIARALDMAGLGADALRLVEVDANHRIRPDALARAMAEDRAAGRLPFLLVGTAGSVDVGAIDDLDALADVAAAHALWFHVDGALGALGVLSPALAPRLRGLERADSVALDFHKWGQVPYDAGFLLCRHERAHRQAFAQAAAYLARGSALGGGERWPCDYGPDLSRGFRALKVWFTLKTYGLDRLGAVIDATCALARRLAEGVAASPELELVAPVGLNIVCFSVRGAEAGARNAVIAADLQREGRCAPSTTRLAGREVIRAAIVNHRTVAADVDALLERVRAHPLCATPAALRVRA